MTKGTPETVCLLRTADDRRQESGHQVAAGRRQKTGGVALEIQVGRAPTDGSILQAVTRGT
jgi:hypothetical protein